MNLNAGTHAGRGQRVGLISDTHGLMRPGAIDALQGVDRILHAGDIDTAAVLDELEGIAPVCAVRGNMDICLLRGDLPVYDIIDIDGILIYLIHDRLQMDLDPAAAGISVVVYGHSHQPAIERQDGVLYINPGSAGPRRFELPISMGMLHINNGSLEPEIITLSK